MTIRVDIGEEKTRLAELVSAAARGEEVIVSRSGVPQARIVGLKPEPSPEEWERIIAKRVASLGMWEKEFEGFDTSIEALKRDRVDYDERLLRKFGPPA